MYKSIMHFLKRLKKRDIDMVNVVLKYNSKPSFINIIPNQGTALHIAILYQNIDMGDSVS